MEEVLAPGVQHRGHADCGAEMLWIGSDGLHRLGRRLEQDAVDHCLVLQRDAGERCSQSEHNMEVWDRQELG